MAGICDGCGAALPAQKESGTGVIECIYCKRQIRLTPLRALDDEPGAGGISVGWLVAAVGGVVAMLMLTGIGIFALSARTDSSAATASPPPEPKPAPTPEPVATAPPVTPQGSNATGATKAIASIAGTFGGEGTGPGKFDGAHNLAVDRHGNVFVVDRTNRVQKFDSNGALLDTFRVETRNAPYNPLTTDIVYGIGIAVDSKDRLYVSLGYDILVLDARSGKLLKKFPGLRGVTCYRQLAVGQTDRIFARTGCTDTNQYALVVLDPSGRVSLRVREPPIYEQTTSDKLGVDANDRIYAAYSYNYEVRVLEPNGSVYTRLGHQGGDVPCEFQYAGLGPVVLDSKGRVYVRESSYVHVFEPNGRCLGRFDTHDQGAADDLAIAPNDELYALTGKDLVVKYEMHFE